MIRDDPRIALLSCLELPVVAARGWVVALDLDVDLERVLIDRLCFAPFGESARGIASMPPSRPSHVSAEITALAS